MIMRDPLERLVACWRYLCYSKAGAWSVGAPSAQKITLGMPLDEFAQALASTPDAERPEQFRSQCWFLHGRAPALVVRLDRLEDEDQSFTRACS
jgi:hypothetical protein